MLSSTINPLNLLGQSPGMVSVIVPTFNSEKYLKACLESVRLQTYKNIEIIVVDNFSNDSTIDVAKMYGCHIFTLRNTWSEALNSGVKQSHGEFYFVLDSDMELMPDLIQCCVEKIQGDPSIAGLIGSEYADGDGFWGKCKIIERKMNVGFEVVEAPRFFRRSVFDQSGGYDTTIEFGDDWEYFQRVKLIGNVRRVESGWIHHEGKPTILGLMMKKYKYARTARRYIRRSVGRGEIGNVIWQCLPIRPYYLRKSQILFQDPKLGFGFFVMKTCEGMASGFALIKSIFDEWTGQELRYGHADGGKILLQRKIESNGMAAP